MASGGETLATVRRREAWRGPLHPEVIEMPDAATFTTARRRLARLLGAEPARWLLVDVARQQLLLIEASAVTRTYPVSTAAAGIDARDGSGGTPPGVHRIERKIGADEPTGAVFASRQPTGEIYGPPAAGDAPDERDLILTRILTLAGLEEGVNRGGGVDSQARYIYLHGTNQEDRIGQPVSHGCIRLTSRDVVDLFDQVAAGDPVVIV